VNIVVCYHLAENEPQIRVIEEGMIRMIAQWNAAVRIGLI
jgi:hypothetical protein